MKIYCQYTHHSTYGYLCRIVEQKISINEKLEFTGMHESRKTDEDVQLIYFGNCSISKIPQRLTEKFPNLEGIEIDESGLKRINRNDLLEYKDFKWFFFGDNEIEYLPGDLFADCKNLEQVIFCGNFLNVVEPNILDGLEHLKYAGFNGKNINYGLIDSETTLASTDAKLVEMKNKFHEQYAIKLQRDNEELSKIKSYIQGNEKFKDFRVNIDDKQFPVHKIFLAARSPTLAEILNGNPEAEYLNLVDISADIFEKILKFLYTDQFPLETNFMQLFAAAKRLKIVELEEYAAEKILDQLDHENAIEVLNLGNKYKHDEMKRNAFQEIKEKYSKIEFNEEWLDDDEKIEKIVEYFLKMQEIEKEFVSSMN